MTLALPLPGLFATGGQGSVALAETAADPAPSINAKVVNENAGKKVLFDNTHGQTAGAADWVIDGGFSDFANGLANDGFYVKELRKTSPITLADLQDYDVFVIGEANIPYKTSEQAAMLQYVQNGGAIFFIGDHYNADRNKNRWDANEVFNGYRRGAWDNPAKGMSDAEAASEAMQGVESSDWLANNFGIRFRYNALPDLTASNIAPPSETFGITTGVNTFAMHAGGTLAILDPKKAKGLVYIPQTNDKWANAVDQGVYNGGGVAEGPFAAIAKVGAGKAAFLGDSSPVEDASPKYLREDTGRSKTTYDGFKEQDDATLLVNTVNWLAKKESYTSFDQVNIKLDQPTQTLDFEVPQNSTEPQAEPWSAPDPGYNWWDPATFKPGAYGSTQAPPAHPVYKLVYPSTIPNAEEFQVRVVADDMNPLSTVNNFNIGMYISGGQQVMQVQNDDGTWPTSYGYSKYFSLNADKIGHAAKTLTVRVKAGTSGDANIRLRQGSSKLLTNAVTIANVSGEPLPEDEPAVPATISVADARATAKGTLVTVEGIVTTQPGAFGGQGFYLQDGTGGVYVYQNESGFNVGDKIRIAAETAVYNDELELSDPILIKKIGTENVPTAKTVTDVNADNQGQLVKLENVAVSNLHTAYPSGSFEFDAVKDGKTTLVRVDGRTGLTYGEFPYTDGQVIDITGVSSIFRGTYQLKPRGLSDFAKDNTQPNTEATVSGTANDLGWSTRDVTVTLTATDDKAGVLRIEYQHTPGAWELYNGPITISDENTTTFKYRAVDKAGNVEDAKELTIKIDKTAPTSSAKATTSANDNGWYKDDVSVVLSADDNASGVAKIEWKLNNGVWTTYENQIAITTEGKNTLQYRATDKAGLVEAVKTLTVNLDKTAPTFTLTQDGQTLHNVLIDGTVSFALTGKDNLSGVATADMWLDGNKINSNASIDALSLGLGTHTVKVRVTDKAGQVTEQQFLFMIESNFDATGNLLDRLAKQGDVKNQGIQTSLHAKLDAAAKLYTAGKYVQADQHLAQLKKTLDDYQKAGNISATAEQVLADNAQYMRDHLLK
ncbi:MAG TPA: DUF5689 domain-containing protein [Bacilli bacterium]|nr:DUF5689 domain-containing protein [Bacilli bacterium]